MREYWILDPVERQLELFTYEAGHFIVHLPMDGRWQSPTLPEVGLDLVELWRELDQEV